MNSLYRTKNSVAFRLVFANCGVSLFSILFSISHYSNFQVSRLWLDKRCYFKLLKCEISGFFLLKNGKQKVIDHANIH